MTTVTGTSGGETFYGYDASNKRIYERDPRLGEVFIFFGAKGEKLGRYGIASGCYPSGAPLCFQAQVTNVWFAGRLVATTNAGGGGAPVYQDRLGTNRATGGYYQTYYPYGDGAAGTDSVQFATYTRDSYTGLDYADQRFYASTYGRFLTADPYRATAKSVNNPADPGSWNRYSYTRGDPVNRRDPRGLMDCLTCIGDGGGGGDDGGDGYCPPSEESCGPDLPTGSVPDSPPQSPPCEGQFSARDVSYVANNFLAADAVSSTAAQGLLSPEFILAWAAVESGFGTSNVSKTNDNFFGEKFLINCNSPGGCVPNTNPNKAAPWKGAVPCAQVSASANVGFACFSGNDLYGSAVAALASHGGKYLIAGVGAEGGGISATAQAIADAGWCQQGNCLNGGYGQQVLQDYNELVPVINCLFPWEGAQIALK